MGDFAEILAQSRNSLLPDQASNPTKECRIKTAQLAVRWSSAPDLLTTQLKQIKSVINEGDLMSHSKIKFFMMLATLGATLMLNGCGNSNADVSKMRSRSTAEIERTSGEGGDEQLFARGRNLISFAELYAQRAVNEFRATGAEGRSFGISIFKPKDGGPNYFFPSNGAGKDSIVGLDIFVSRRRGSVTIVPMANPVASDSLRVGSECLASLCKRKSFSLI
jgi:hypothetical protein